MAVVNFSVPDSIKEKFDKAFAEKNKSRIISELMQHAVEGQARLKQRQMAIDALLKIRKRAAPVTTQQISKARNEGRR